MSGLREQRVHLYVGFGTAGASLHGTMGIKIDVISAAEAAIAEYINFFFNCMFKRWF